MDSNSSDDDRIMRLEKELEEKKKRLLQLSRDLEAGAADDTDGSTAAEDAGGEFAISLHASPSISSGSDVSDDEKEVKSDDRVASPVSAPSTVSTEGAAQRPPAAYPVDSGVRGEAVAMPHSSKSLSAAQVDSDNTPISGRVEEDEAPEDSLEIKPRSHHLKRDHSRHKERSRHDKRDHEKTSRPSSRDARDYRGEISRTSSRVDARMESRHESRHERGRSDQGRSRERASSKERENRDHEPRHRNLDARTRPTSGRPRPGDEGRRGHHGHGRDAASRGDRSDRDDKFASRGRKDYRAERSKDDDPSGVRKRSRNDTDFHRSGSEKGREPERKRTKRPDSVQDRPGRQDPTSKGKSSDGKVKRRRPSRSLSSSSKSSSDDSGRDTDGDNESTSSGSSDEDTKQANAAFLKLKTGPPASISPSVPAALQPISPLRRYTTSASEDESPYEEEMSKPGSLAPSPEPPIPPDVSLYFPAVQGCRSVDEFECLNRIEEGTYGVVYRGREKKTNEIVALKRLKMEKEKEGFPITSLREINTLLKSKHQNVVHVREIVVGSNMDKIYLVMEYVEHDLKTLMESMKEGFLIGEVKTLLRQLLRAVHHLHDNWILHRDLKTSNLLLSHKGILKVGDFGLAREYGSPPKPYTPIVVTLWYRAPELLLGVKTYTTAVDMWSVGCIFAELVQMKPLFTGKSEIDQIQQIFKLLGTPNDRIWPGWSELPHVKRVTFAEQPYNRLRDHFSMQKLTNCGIKLLNRFLTFDPNQRITADKAQRDAFFEETPLPVDPSMFPTWPARSELPKRVKMAKSPTAPEGGGLIGGGDEDGGGFFLGNVAKHGSSTKGQGFTLKF